MAQGQVEPGDAIPGDAGLGDVGPGDAGPDDGDDAEVASPRLTVATVARRLGVAPATLRTWDRRYGLGPSEHRFGAHRRYSADDMRRLLVMQRLTHDGVAPAEAAAIARQTLAGVVAPSTTTTAVTIDELPQRPPPPDGNGPPARTGGGRVVAVPAGSPAVRGLARAAMALDAPECSRLVGEHLDRHGTVRTWEELLVPVLGAVGERWSTTGGAIEVEHMLTESILASVRPRAAPHPGRRTVLLSAAEEEQHSLPLHVLAAACAERGVATRMLGARVPSVALAAAVRRTGPVAVVVYAQMPVRDPAQLHGFPRLRPRPLLLLGGPGWAGVADLDGAERLDTLRDAVERLVEVTGG